MKRGWQRREGKTESSWEKEKIGLWGQRGGGEFGAAAGREKNLESRTEEREERERSWERGVEKGFSAKGIFGIFQVRIREHI